MRKLIFTSLFSTLICFLWAQGVPQKFNYQAVARNASGAVLANTSIAVKFTVLDSVGNNVYSETHTGVSTDQFGLFSLQIGTGTAATGAIANIATATQPVSLKVEFDPANGTNWINMGTSELVSVPYALYAANAPMPPATNITAGNGITVSGTAPNFTVTNTLPDTIVQVSAGTGMSVSGTYPSFTITNTAPDNTLQLTAGTGINISGSYPAYTVTNSAPNQNQTLSFDTLTRTLTLSNGGGSISLLDLMPPGTIVAYGGVNPPKGWLLCDGLEYNNSQYPALAAAIGANFGSSAPATKFRVPDMRGRFLRGVAGTATSDPDKNNRAVPSGSILSSNNVGSSQNSSFPEHNHIVFGHSHDAGSLYGKLHHSQSLIRFEEISTPAWQKTASISVAGQGDSGTETNGLGIGGNTGTTSNTNTGGVQNLTGETRPTNIYVNYIIKY